MSILDKKKQGNKDNVKGEFLVMEDPFHDKYPGIFELLARVKYLGKDRKAGRLIMYAELNRATLVLCDVEAGEVTFYAAETFNKALMGLEVALQDGSCDWRIDKKSRFQK